ncbi:MAG: hypothetical protein ABI675_19450 [Chitinophagaceae bacterium]
MPPKKTTVDYSTYTPEQFIAELEASQKAAADNLELAGLAEKKCEETAQEITVLKSKLATSENDIQIQAEERRSYEKKSIELSDELAIVSKVNEELSITIENLTKQLDAKKTIADAAQEIAEKKTPPIPTSSFTVDGKSYKFISPVFVYQKQRIVAADAINNQDLLNELVAAKVGSIVSV